MKRLRLQARKLSLLALFALALQLGLSFAHTHASDFARIGTPTVSAPADAPDTDHEHNAAGDICDICATIALARSLLDATPPVLPIPASYTAARHAVMAQSDAPDAPRPAFRSRAPPSI
jgi:hypothetical protein